MRKRHHEITLVVPIYNQALNIILSNDFRKIIDFLGHTPAGNIPGQVTRDKDDTVTIIFDLWIYEDRPGKLFPLAHVVHEAYHAAVYLCENIDLEIENQGGGSEALAYLIGWMFDACYSFIKLKKQEKMIDFDKRLDIK